MRLPIAESMESLIFTRAGANINKVSLASSECVCVCVCVCVCLYKIPRPPNICATICGALTKFTICLALYSHCSMKRSATSPVSTGIFVTGIAMFNFLYYFSSSFVFEKKQPLAAKITFFRDNPPLFSEIVAFHARNLTFPPIFSNYSTA